MKIEICCYNKNDYNIVKEIFSDIENIIVVKKSIVDADSNCIVSAGNSFAEMNGGVDGIINTHLSSYTPDKYIQQDVKNRINSQYGGELPVGISILVPTNHPKHNFLIYTPTMRVAEDVSNTINAYLAFRSVVLLAVNNNLGYISTPLFCTGAGNMSIEKSCKQMKEAYLSVINGSLINGDWKQYHKHHRYLHSL